MENLPTFTEPYNKALGKGDIFIIDFPGLEYISCISF